VGNFVGTFAASGNPVDVVTLELPPMNAAALEVEISLSQLTLPRCPTGRPHRRSAPWRRCKFAMRDVWRPFHAEERSSPTPLLTLQKSDDRMMAWPLGAGRLTGIARTAIPPDVRAAGSARVHATAKVRR
jgi:hypothetical protein